MTLEAARPAPVKDGYLVAIARSVGVPPFWMDDCLQEMRIRIWKKGQDGPVSTRLAAVIAHRAAIDFMRWAGRRRGKQAASVATFSMLEADSPSAFEELLSAPGADDVADVGAGMVDLRQALATLQERERTVVIMRVLYGFQAWRIGEQLGISPTRVNQLWARAIVKVRRLTGETLA